MSNPVKINLEQKFSLFKDHWSPKIIGELNENFIKLVKFQGDFVWHSHKDEDELFIIIKGKLVIKFRDRELTAIPGEIILIPKGVEHCPCVKEEVWAMVIEPKTVVNTGDVVDKKTVKDLEKI
ncbi:MAG: cupin domain-containing protein [Rickettsiales bacterium]|nr:cupin domain-containing protein [Rickettsiales bacterium]